MYSGVPTLESASYVCDEKARPSPRSPSFTDPLDARKMFAGLMSRCMIRASCMWRMPSHTWTK